MVLIVLSWIYIFFTAVNFGVLFTKALRLKVSDFAVFSILGIFAVALITTIWAVFGRINWEFHSALFCANLILFFSCQKQVLAIYDTTRSRFMLLSRSLKLLLFMISVLIVAQCASAPYIVDNESYYIQTVKWLNEYGFVKGLANLHFYFAQTSGWHIAQSAFSFSFLYPNFNDLSGFCLLIGTFFSISRLDDYFKSGDKTNLIVGLLPVANVLLFQFISSPSPDLPVYILSFMIFYYFLESYDKMDISTFNLLVALVLFAVFIKTTAAALCLFPLLLLIRYPRLLFPKIGVSVFIAAFTFGLFMAKNYIVSGYPLFPIVSTHFGLPDFALPQSMAHFYYEQTRLTGFLLTQNQYEAMDPLSVFRRWITLPKLHGIFNAFSLFLIVVSPLLVYRFFNRRRFWLLYLVMCVEMVLLFLSSPQYRFFLNFILVFSFLWLAALISNRKYIVWILSFSTCVTAFVLFVPVGLSPFTKNRFASEASNFSINHLIFPHPNSKTHTGFELLHNGNMDYYSPIQNDFFWGCGDGKLPCVNEKQLEYFERHFHVVPQLRTKNLKDGFISKAKP
jgi:hypothetical protein